MHKHIQEACIHVCMQVGCPVYTDGNMRSWQLKLWLPYFTLYSKNLTCYSTCKELLISGLCETAHTPYTGSTMSLPLEKWNWLCWWHFIAKFNQDMYNIWPVQLLYIEIQTASKVNMLTGNDSPHKSESSLWDVAEDRL